MSESLTEIARRSTPMIRLRKYRLCLENAYVIIQLKGGQCVAYSFTVRAAFKFGRGVYFALRRKMRKPPISRVPAI